MRIHHFIGYSTVSTLRLFLVRLANCDQVLVVPVYGRIEQLIISPNGAFLAIVTAHTIHIAVLPDSSHLSGPDYSPFRLKTYQLGPTTHVIPESPVVSALWHPLGIRDNNGGCIITVTADAAVRVWEIDTRNRWSFDRPTVAVDLKKLVDGTSADEDFAPLAFGQNKGFSADIFDMEVASATFGGHGHEAEVSRDEDAWAAMTLWVAMRPGDVYALCPLLPSKWRASSLTIPSLTTSIVNKLSAAQDESFDSNDDLRVTEQQYEWLKEIDNQGFEEDSEFTEIRLRPTYPSPIPRLQGPFLFDIDEDDDDELDLTDIFVIAAKADLEDLMDGDEAGNSREESDREGLSATIICLATATGAVHICLELDGVEGQWLPRSSTSTYSSPVSEPSDLLLLETLETVRSRDQDPDSWPTFSEDIGSRYSFFVTTARSVVYLSLSSWVQRVEPEIQSLDTAGSAFRINIICDGTIAQREQVMQLPSLEYNPDKKVEHLSNCLVIFDYDIGYLLLTYSPSQTCAVVLDSPEYAEYVASRELSPFDPAASTQQMLITAPKRSPYQVPSIFYSLSPLTSFIEENVPHGHRHTLKDSVRLSPSTLDLITVAHRILSSYTHALERAASDLFRRCERLQGEMQDQLGQLVEIGERVNNVSQGTVRGAQNRGPVGREEALDSRVSAAEQRQKQLVERYSNIRKRLAEAGGRPMSESEKGWIGEVEKFSESIGAGEAEDKGELTQRFETVCAISAPLNLIVLSN